MPLHPIQQKLLNLTKHANLGEMSYRKIGQLIGVNHPQQVVFHLKQLEKKGLIKMNKKLDNIALIKRGITKIGKLVNIPILGAANCGDATIFADQCLEGYLKVSPKIISANEEIFAIKAKGNSMNRADIFGLSIEDGDYVIINKDKEPQNGDYVLTVIDDAANIKKYIEDKKNDQITLMSESTEVHSPIYLHPDDKFVINGVVKKIMKNPKTN